MTSLIIDNMEGFPGTNQNHEETILDSLNEVEPPFKDKTKRRRLLGRSTSSLVNNGELCGSSSGRRRRRRLLGRSQVGC